jgi:Zn-dependent M28 family amino/carboxypeptidase
VAILLALAEALSQKEINHDLEFVAFTGEEYLPLGDDEYVRRCGDSFDSMIAAINFDGVGLYIGSTSITMFSASPQFENAAHKIIDQHPGIVWVEPWPESNHSTFAWRGVPSIAFSTAGGVSLEHLRIDTIDWIDPQKLKHVIDAAQDMIGLLQDKTASWTRTA